MHADYFESKLYVYKAILSDEQPEDLIGEETALVDFLPVNKDDGSTAAETVMFGLKPDTSTNTDTGVSKFSATQPLNLTSSIIVEPQPGRLALFSSGGENFHAPLEVTRGKRTFHVGSNVKSEDREYRQKTTNWGECKSREATVV